jgi:uncharacterized phage-associated protein
MLDCFDVADFLICNAGHPEYGVSDLTPLKLQKLLYYCQAWSLVFRDSPLFRDRIEAWVHGPVVPRVYHKYKEFGYSPISGHRSLKGSATSDVLKILEKVLKSYGRKNGRSLECLTHSELPWKLAREELEPTQKSQRVISLDWMKSYYSSFADSEDIEKAMIRALNKPERPRKSNIVENFMEGFGSSLKILSSRKIKSFKIYTTEDFSTDIFQAESLDAIWEKTGSYYYKVMDEIKKDLEKK